MRRLSANTPVPRGMRSRNAFGDTSKAKMQMIMTVELARSESSVASSEKYVCSLFIV